MEFANLATQEWTVSSFSPLDAKEQVRQAIDIVDLIGSVVQLRRQGRILVGLCPWHDDSRPSLQVNPERQTFKCWVCDIGGDVFSFVMKMDGVEFREALAILADRAGISLKSARPRPHAAAHDPDQPSSTSQPSANEGKRTLYKAMAWAESQYHHCLLESPDAEPARRYLSERGIAQQSIARFRLGFVPNERDWILRRIHADPKRAKVLETIGILARPPEGGALYDRFRGRVLFPIHDIQGRPIGLGGRVLPELGTTSPAKYVNSPETPLFRKSEHLYGLDVAREAIHKSRTALVMEGYTDCIVAQQYGFGDAVAVLGTALGENHIRVLKRFADRIVLVLDGDEAGQRRTNEVLELFVAQQVNLHILTLPEQLDPCEYLHRFGAERFAQLLAENTVDALDHAFASATRGLDFEKDLDGVQRALERLLTVIARAPRLGAASSAQHQARQWRLLSRLALRFRIPEETIRQRLQELRRSSMHRAPATRSAAVSPPGDAPSAIRNIATPERELLELLLAYPECWTVARREIDPQRMLSECCQRIFQTSCRLLDEGMHPDSARLLLQFDEPAMKSLIVELDEAAATKRSRDADALSLLRALIHNFQQQETQRERPAQIVALRERRLDDSQEAALLDEIIRQERNRQGISKPMDG